MMLQEKVAIVTGGARDIGKAVSKRRSCLFINRVKTK